MSQRNCLPQTAVQCSAIVPDFLTKGLKTSEYNQLLDKLNRDNLQKQ